MAPASILFALLTLELRLKFAMKDSYVETTARSPFPGVLATL